MNDYKGSCHCGAISFEFSALPITKGLRCNCSLCIRKGALMSEFTLDPGELNIHIKDNTLQTYEFGSLVAKHHFCSQCGIYPFHQTMRKPGHYRINLACVDHLDVLNLPFQVFDGASL